MKEFISKEKIFANATKLSEILLESKNYEEFHQMLSTLDIDLAKTYDMIPSGFIDFNNHLYEDINHMNSISTGLYLEKSFVTFRIFIWTSLGEGFVIFKHILRGQEIDNLKSIEDVKRYFFTHLNELEEGIKATYNKNIEEALEDFGRGIENKKLPLPSILSKMTIENNIKDI